MSNIKRKKLNKIFPLFLAINSMSQGTFADSKIHNIKENKEVIDAAKEQKIESKKQEVDEKGKQTDKPKISESEIKKQTRNYKKIGAISLLSAGAIISPTYAVYYFGFPIYAKHAFNNFLISAPPDIAKSASWAKYMDTQPHDGSNTWCQFFAFQGILNKEFNIKCKVTDLYDIAFPNESDHRNQKKTMMNEVVRKDFMNKVMAKYGITRKPYIVIKDMTMNHAHSEDYDYIDKPQVKQELIKAYEKCGSLCINNYCGYEHAVLLVNINKEKNEATIESFGFSYLCDLDKLIDGYVYKDYDSKHGPDDFSHDGCLRIYGFEK